MSAIDDAVEPAGDPIWRVRAEFGPRLDAIYNEGARRRREADEWVKEERRKLDEDFRKRLAEVRAAEARAR